MKENTLNAAQTMSEHPATNSEEWYYKFVTECAKARRDVKIPNGKAEHARFLISVFFEHASKHIRLFSGSLKQAIEKDGDVTEIYRWPNLISSVICFLQKPNTHLDIIVASKIDGGIDNHPLLNAIYNMGEDYRNKVDVRELNARGITPWLSPHFLVADSTGYRIEVDDKNVKAFANFNEEKVASRLEKAFDKLKLRGKEIPVFSSTALASLA